MRYFRLLDDLEIVGRWHLGEVRRGSRPALDLWSGVKICTTETLSVDITHFGRPLEFCLTTFAVPVVANHLGQAILGLASSDVQLLPLEIRMNHDYSALNVTRVISCLDDNRSEHTKWTERDHRPDLVGQYRMVTKLYLDKSRIPQNVDIFRIDNWLIGLVVSDRLRGSMLSAGCFGARFVEIPD
jgi:hypothetical protein